MARINNRPSTVAGSRTASPTPVPSTISDQENRDPDTTSTRPDKGKGRVTMDEPERGSLPTPEDSESSRGQKRKRVEVTLTQAADLDSDMSEDEAKMNRYFDPNQDHDKRRQIKRKSRAMVRAFNESRDDLLSGDGTGLKDTIHRANNIFKNIKQTGDATVDSRLFVDVSNLAYKRSKALVNGENSFGVDAEEFLTKAITYMKNGGPLNVEQQAATSTQARRTQRRDEDEDDDPDDEPLDWETFGQIACFPYNVRPACPSFLLGPLSVEKKQRKQTQRTARQSKDTVAREARPQDLSKEDFSQAEENTLTATCTRLRKHLEDHCHTQMAALRQRFQRKEELRTPQGKTWLKEHRFTLQKGPYLFDYAVNPHSFGQTVENLFHISFLIKEGHAGISQDDDGLPVIIAANPTNVEQKRAMKSTKHQAVFSLDYSTWQRLIEAFDIHEPMIAHRSEAQTSQVGRTGWYA